MQDDGDGRSVEFDAWLAGRSAALTRFAYLLTGSEVDAELALGPALTVACATWSRIRRSDDPEAHVQRLVVEEHLSRGGRRRRKSPAVAVPSAAAIHGAPDEEDATLAWRLCATLPPERRVAVVLRCYSTMTYPQIAAVMGSKEASVRDHVERAFDSLRDAIDGRRSGDEIEAAFRECFAEHGEEPIDPGGRAALAHAAAGRRRRRRTLIAVATAAVLALGIGGVAVSYDGGEPAATVMPKPGDHPRGWRAESYNGIQLWVPSSWGWGQVPRLTSHGLVSCGLHAYSPTAMVTGARYVMRGGTALPYVGRPAEPDAGCGARPTMTGSHVWFDSPLTPGAGPAQTTVRVQGLTPFAITVADANRAERAMIVASIEPVAVDAHGCPRDAAGIKGAAGHSAPAPPSHLLRSLSFCLYATAARQPGLFYSTQIEGAEARATTAQLAGATKHRLLTPCVVAPAGHQMLLIARSPGSSSVFLVDAGACDPGIAGYVGPWAQRLLPNASRRLWAIDGLSVYAGVLGVEAGMAPGPSSH